MENFTVLLWSAVITALAFFVVTPCVMNTVSLFGVQKTFARKMIGLGILKEADFRALHPKKTAAGVLRVSFAPETTKEDIDALVSALRTHRETRFPML